MPRQLSTYEKTHLARFGKSKIDIDKFGEMPVEYITGQVEFGDHVFTITPDTLIPRIETEELVKLATELLLKKTPPVELVIGDIGCGCGAIGLTLGMNLFQQQRLAKIWLADISAPAVTVAQQNLKKIITSDHQQQFITLVSDLMASFPSQTKFDLLVANLPYIPTQRINYLDESVKDHEPNLALDGGPDGLTLIRQFLHQAVNFLKPDGNILLEIDYTHTQNEIQACLPTITSAAALANFHCQIIDDSFNRQRFALIKASFG